MPFFRNILILCILICWIAIKSFGQSIGVRNGHNMVYDPDSRRIILFGGADESKVYGDTWSFANGKWNKITDDGPSSRSFPGMVMANHYILLFGGNRVLFGNEKNPTHYLDDTWIFKDGHWKEIKTRIHPGPRAEMAMGYDPVKKIVLLFGGRQSGEQWILDDTWIFDGTQWKEIKQKGPSARSGTVMSYDNALHSLILFGGNPVIAKEKNYNGPMWLWDETGWHPMKSKDSLIFNSAMTYDTTAHVLVRFGGWTGTIRSQETWLYDTAWQKLNFSISPPGRNHSIMVYDTEKKECILFGGHDGENVFGDMWTFKNNHWNFIGGKEPRKRIDNGH